MWTRFLVVFFALVNGNVRAQSENFDDWLDTKSYNLYPTLPNAAPFSDNEQCREDSRRMIENLRNNTLWAVQMRDSSASSAFGILQGNSFQLGNFQECLVVSEPIKTRYCLVNYKSRIHDEEILKSKSNFNLTVWKQFQNFRNDDVRVARDEILWALCVPASCTAKEMENAVNLHLNTINEESLIKHGISYHVEISDGYCTDSTEIPYSYGEIGFWTFTALVVVSAVLATLLDVSIKHDSAIRKKKAFTLLMSFSLKRNASSFFKTHGDKKPDNPFMFLHGVKFVSMVLIVFVHKSAYGLFAVTYNREALENLLYSVHKNFLPQGDLTVDTFFFITGLIATYMMLEVLEKKRINFFVMFFARFIRLAPLYFYLVWAQATVIERLGTGPIWKIVEGRESEYCRKNWWANLLFIQNYVNPKEMCFIHSWYLPCDLHYFVVVMIFTFIYKKQKKVAACFIYVLVALSIASTGVVTYMYKLMPILKFEPSLLMEPRLYKSFEYSYAPSHTRAAVYLIGMITAYHLFDKRKSTWKMSKTASTLMCLSGLALFFLPMYYGGLYYQSDNEYNLIETTIFCMLRRTFWAFGWVLIMFVNRFGVIPIFGEVFSCSFWEPLSKLVYGLYLIHFILAMANTSKAKIPAQVSLFEMFYETITLLCFSVAYAFVTFLFLERPIKVALTNLLLKSPKSKHLNTKKTQLSELETIRVN